MHTMIEIGGGPFTFSAAHAGLHDDEFEPLHGHTFTLTLRLAGELDEAGMLTDFHRVKKTLAEVIAPLKRQTLMPGNAPGVTYRFEDGQVLIEGGTKRYSLPTIDVLLLPVVNTTTEAIAVHLAGQLLPYVREESGVRGLELTLAEAADTAATVTIDLATSGTLDVPCGAASDPAGA